MDMFQGISVSLNPIEPWWLLVVRRARRCSVLTLWAYAASSAGRPGALAMGRARPAARWPSCSACWPRCGLRSSSRRRRSRPPRSSSCVDSSTEHEDRRRGPRPDPLGRGAEDPRAGRSRRPRRSARTSRSSPTGSTRPSNEPKPDEKARRARGPGDRRSARPCSRPRSARPRATSGSPGWSILSDVATNSGVNPLVAARRLRDQQVPVVTVGFGSENAGANSRDIAVREIVAAPDRLRQEPAPGPRHARRPRVRQPDDRRRAVRRGADRRRWPRRRSRSPREPRSVPITGLKYIPRRPARRRSRSGSSPSDGELRPSRTTRSARSSRC